MTAIHITYIMLYLVKITIMDHNIQCKAALLMEIAFESEESENDDLNFIIHSSSSDDEDEEKTVKNLHTVLNKNRRKLNKRPQVKGFVRVIPGYMAKEFKTHFWCAIFILTANV